MTVEPTGKPNEQPEIVLAGWGTRFWAWLIDFIIVNVAIGVLFAIVAMPVWLTGFMNPGMMANGQWWNNVGGPFSYAISSLVFFGYWTYMESRYNGQSIGKMLLRIRTTNLEGKPADTKSIAISSFGKAFILPLDVLLGWIFTNEKRQRLLSRAANTIVVKMAEDAPGDIRYRKE
ncbi:MAG TPA: RDD family protein [Nitrososphaera sp.]|nr:RDD family protein [Nitrososphaera sp.]HXV45211.1 RDD family protein [Nitrososphaera sp.]